MPGTREATSTFPRLPLWLSWLCVRRSQLLGSVLSAVAVVCAPAAVTAEQRDRSGEPAGEMAPGSASDLTGLRLPPAAQSTVLQSASLDAARESASEPDPAVEELLRRLEQRDTVVEELKQRLEDRDASVRQLEDRVEQLERLIKSIPGITANGNAATSPAAVARTEPSAPAPTQTSVKDQADRNSNTTAQVPDDAQTPPGQVTVDPEAAERALERTLVLTGDLLLPVGKADVEPFVSYQFDDTTSSALLNAGGDLIATNRRVERDEISAGVNLRVGLPFDSQIEFGLPYEFVRQQENQELSAEASDDDSGSGIGDLRVGVAKTLIREEGWIPDLVGRITWDSDTGENNDNGVALNSDFHEIIGSVSAIKRQDPFAFVGRLSYEHAFENDNIQPADRFGVGAAAFLAASPETSLSLAFNASFRDDLEINGTTINGSDENQATLSFGVSSVLARGTLLNVTAAAGLTDDSPDYSIFMSLPVRLTLW